MLISISLGEDGVGDEDYTQCDISMQGASSLDLEDGDVYNGAAQIKLHGNSTLYRYKSPYKVKLQKKTDLLGLGKLNNSLQTAWTQAGRQKRKTQISLLQSMMA